MHTCNVANSGQQAAPVQGPVDLDATRRDAANLPPEWQSGVIALAEELAGARALIENSSKDAVDSAAYRRINTPEVAHFVHASYNEAMHQRLRWGPAHDMAKSNEDWYALLGYLAGKAQQPDIPLDKRLHHVIATSAACFNWHGVLTGSWSDREAADALERARTQPRGPIQHSLKCDSEVFNAVADGRKTHEIRFDDRDYRLGDVLLLKETVYSAAEMQTGAPVLFTGQEIWRVVSHVLTGYGLFPGWVCLSLESPNTKRAALGPDTAANSPEA